MTPKTLLSPTALGPYTLSNHTVMAPLTRGRAGPGDVPTELSVEYYRQRAGAGLIITEGSQISAQGKGYTSTPGIYTEAQVEGWRHVTQAVHAEGGRIFLQLWHVGRMSHSLTQEGGKLPVAPSAIPPEGEIFTAEGPKPYEVPQELTVAEIAGIVADFRHAAECARRAGFDGVEIHGANSYLIDQFLRDGSNHRTDAYGGPIGNRLRFLREVTEAVIQVWGAERVGVRISPIIDFGGLSDTDPQRVFNAVADLLKPYGLAYLHVVEMGPQPFDFRELRQRFGGIYIANGGYDASRAEAALTDGSADLVAFGVPFLANPDLVERFRLGAALNAPDQATFYGGNERGYTDYPTLALQGENA
ncbi:alkene reductase (plasmid) [Agrobacterium tumefaciens]|uniref:Alkene reductase n=2 Tax=Agrobacterium tumefaciens TaxID=358 RepID=A0AAJ4N8F4_AGRTU|nr:alkene reductase [Agrobacterium tumefaciens]